MTLDLITELGIVIISCGIFGVIAYFLKQPLVFAYVLAGITIGPYGLGIIQDTFFLDSIAKIGVVLLLFLIGLEMNIQKLKELGITALVVGIGQVLFTGAIGYTMIQIFDLQAIQEIYLTIAIVFSSTVIAVKLISDKKETQSLYGQICIGVLIVQDILAIIALLVLSGFSEGFFDIAMLGKSMFTGFIVAIISTLIANKILKYLYSNIAQSHELLILFSITWCFIVALTCYKMGFSKEIGAFIAGLNLANLPYTFEINSKAKILRDFFITLFFAALGANLIFTDIQAFIIPIILLSLFVLIGNPIIVMFIMGRMGYDKRTSFFTGLNIANISEFSLIVLTMGKSLGHIHEDLYSAVGIIAITTMIISSYMITYNNFLYQKLKHILKVFELKKTSNKKQVDALSDHIILFGSGEIGEQILEQITQFKEDYIVIDNDNKIIKHLMKENIHCMFGDAADEEVLQELMIENAEIVISTIPSTETNIILLKYISYIPSAKKPFTIIVASNAREGMDMLIRGADYVIVKPYLSATHIHKIHEELYDLPKNIKKRKLLPNTQNHKHTPEKEIAKILMNINKMRLQEIKEKKYKQFIRSKSSLI